MTNKPNILMNRGINTNLSYLTLRKIIGYSGLLLPFIVWVVAWKYEPSISDYYYTRSSVIFTGILFLCGAFLISYRGYEIDKKKKEKISDNLTTWISGILIIIVAGVPTPYDGEAPCQSCPTPICNCSDAWGWVHFSSAALFFICMGYLSIFHFTRRDLNKPYTDKDKLNDFIFRGCGYAMWSLLAFAGLMFLCCEEELHKHFVFWVEVALLILFGTSWLVKGKVLVDMGLQKAG